MSQTLSTKPGQVQLGMMQFRGQFLVEWNRSLAFITLTLMPSIVFFLAGQRYIVSGLTGGAVRG